MSKKQSRTTARTSTAGAPRAARYVVSVLCVAILTAGFFFAARQHFVSMDLGIRNSRLRSQIDQLEGEKRRLILGREIALAAPEIKKAAKRAGITSDASLARTATTTAPAEPKGERARVVEPAAKAPLIVKTASVISAPVAPTPAVARRTEKVTKENRRVLSAE